MYIQQFRSLLQMHKGVVLKTIPLLCVRLPGHTDVLDQQAKLTAINCAVQRLMDAEPLELM